MIKSRVTDILVCDQQFAILMDIEQTARFGLRGFRWRKDH